MNSFDHCSAESRDVKNVGVPLATELIEVIIFFNDESQKYFRRKTFGREIQNIMKHIDTYPFGEMKICYIVFVNLSGGNFFKNPPINEPFKTFLLQYSLKMTRYFNLEKYLILLIKFL